MDSRQIPQKEALPGDIIILSDKNNYPKHAVMFDKVVNRDTGTLTYFIFFYDGDGYVGG